MNRTFFIRKASVCFLGHLAYTGSTCVCSARVSEVRGSGRQYGVGGRQHGDGPLQRLQGDVVLHVQRDALERTGRQLFKQRSVSDPDDDFSRRKCKDKY